MISNPNIILIADDQVEELVVKSICLLKEWLLKTTSFPRKLSIHLINESELMTSKGEAATGSFFAPYDPAKLSKIKIAVGDFIDESKEYGVSLVLQNYYYTYAHEIIHYQQWIEEKPFREREAVSKAEDMIDQFVKDELESIKKEFWKRNKDFSYLKERFKISILDVQLELIEMIGELKTKESLEWLVKLAKDKNESVRCQAIINLGNSNSNNVAKVLISCLKNDGSPIVQAYAAESLQYIGDKSCLPFLIQALADKDPDVRGCAAFAIGWLKEESCKRILKERLKNEKSPRARLRFYASLYLLGDTKMESKLYFYLSNRSPYVREAASGYIYQLLLDKKKSYAKLKEVIDREKVQWVKVSMLETLHLLNATNASENFNF